ncbi:hypothetical protein [Mesorhizobium sp. WSM2239]|uniref:SIR2-like domain-containing protein n=2 Tax=unclassified Mesorhizobium TaxID=325217 RepID=A0AAU8DFE0_9HYPH
MIPHIISGNTVTAFVGGDLRTVDSSHPNFDEIRTRLRAGAVEHEIVPLLDIASALRDMLLYEDDIIKVGYDCLTYNDRPLNNYLTRKIIDMARAKIPISPWIAFLKRLQDNPDPEVKDGLFEWLERGAMPITPDGYFLAYKKVRDDYLSYHDSETLNALGSTIFLPSDKYDHDRARICSAGLHFCSWDYLPSYHGSEGRVLIVKINPADVVAFNGAYSGKGRARRYTIVSEVPFEEAQHAFPEPVYETDFDDELEPFFDGYRWSDGHEPSVGIIGRLRAWTRRLLN